MFQLIDLVTDLQPRQPALPPKSRFAKFRFLLKSFSRRRRQAAAPRFEPSRGGWIA
jgi:hypothetical protein